MVRLILYVILVIADLFFCVFDIAKGYYLFSVIWGLLAAYFVYLSVSTVKSLRSDGSGNEKTD